MQGLPLIPLMLLQSVASGTADGDGRHCTLLHSRLLSFLSYILSFFSPSLSLSFYFLSLSVIRYLIILKKTVLLHYRVFSTLLSSYAVVCYNGHCLLRLVISLLPVRSILLKESATKIKSTLEWVAKKVVGMGREFGGSDMKDWVWSGWFFSCLFCSRKGVESCLFFFSFSFLFPFPFPFSSLINILHAFLTCPITHLQSVWGFKDWFFMFAC